MVGFELQAFLLLAYRDCRARFAWPGTTRLCCCILSLEIGIVSGCTGSVPGLEERNMASTPKKCANPACTCTAPNKEKYCSAHCEGIADKIEIVCTCGHEGCTHAGMRA